MICAILLQEPNLLAVKDKQKNLQLRQILLHFWIVDCDSDDYSIKLRYSTCFSTNLDDKPALEISDLRSGLLVCEAVLRPLGLTFKTMRDLVCIDLTNYLLGNPH